MKRKPCVLTFHDPTPVPPPSRPPDYLVIGHVTRDLLAGREGYAPGGTATYSSIAAQRLGLQAAIVTSLAPEDGYLVEAARQAGVWVHTANSPSTTTFRNTYDERGHRTQVLSVLANPIDPADVPSEWRSAPVVHLGPVAQELPGEMADLFPGCLLGVTPQGWMRSWNEAGEVSHSAHPVPVPLRDLPSNAFLVVSIEDLGYSRELLADYVELAPLVAVTQGGDEAYIYRDGRKISVPALSARLVDPTGAGDIFATALLVRYRETGDLETSARFAHAAAACVIEGRGLTAIPDRRAVEARMRTGKEGC